MTTFFQPPNPGARLRQTVREALAAWIEMAHIPGVTRVYGHWPGGEIDWSAWPGAGTGFAAQIWIRLGDDTESIEAFTGGADRGGNLLHVPVDIVLAHQAYSKDDARESPASENDRDRIYDALKDCFRGAGRAAGRPDVFLSVGFWPREAAMWGQHAEPVSPGESICRVSTLSLTASAYLPQIPPGA
jgi:hypothetical protein